MLWRSFFEARQVFVIRWIPILPSSGGPKAPQNKDLLPVSLPLFLLRSGSNARGESRALEGRRVSSKSPSRVRDGDEGVARRNVRERIIFLIKATPIQPKKLKFRKFRFLRPDDLGADPKNQNFEISDFWGTWDRQKDQKGRKFENSDFWACYPALKTKKAKNQKKRQGECATTPLLPPHPHPHPHHLPQYSEEDEEDQYSGEWWVVRSMRIVYIVHCT